MTPIMKIMERARKRLSHLLLKAGADLVGNRCDAIYHRSGWVWIRKADLYPKLDPKKWS